jgi:hypothetical protein
MRLFVGMPWWMALALGALLLPYLVVAGVARIVLEVLGDLRRPGA